MFVDKKFRLPRIWSNRELKKFAHLFKGDVINVSAWKDEDKEGRHYKDYFKNSQSYSITNYESDMRGFQGNEGEIFLNLENDLPESMEGKYDVVFNHTTLEHIFHFRKAFNNLCLLSKDVVIVVVPFLQQMHTNYGDYWRFTPLAIKKMFEENNMEVIYSSFNEHQKSSVYLFFIASKKPDQWNKIKNKFSYNLKNKKITLDNTNQYVGFGSIKNSILYEVFNFIREGLKGVVKKSYKIKKRIFKIFEKYLAKTPTSFYLRVVPWLFTLTHFSVVNKSLSFKIINEELIKVKEYDDCLYIYSPRRAQRYLKWGVNGIKAELVRRYFPSKYDISRIKDAVIIDVGANIGEFSLACIERGAKEVIAIEPDGKAFKCLEKNLNSKTFKSKLYQVALNKKTGKGKFYFQSDTADSSLITPNKFTHSLEIDMIKLDDLLHKENLDKIDILKVEAEGAEPEVLLGATKLLDKVSFVTVRASNERRGKSTYSACEELLQKAGFKCWDGGDGKQLLAEKI